MLGEEPVDPIHMFIALGAVENLGLKGRKPPGWLQETEFPMSFEERDVNFRYGPWFVRAFGISGARLVIGVSRVPLC